jgi:hypothetical protein
LPTPNCSPLPARCSRSTSPTPTTAPSFGASVYRRLLAAAGVARSPSGQTVAAVLAERRAQPTASIDAERRGLLDDGLRAFLHKEIQVAWNTATVMVLFFDSSAQTKWR